VTVAGTGLKPQTFAPKTTAYDVETIKHSGPHFNHNRLNRFSWLSNSHEKDETKRVAMRKQSSAKTPDSGLQTHVHKTSIRASHLLMSESTRRVSRALIAHDHAVNNVTEHDDKKGRGNDHACVFFNVKHEKLLCTWMNT